MRVVHLIDAAGCRATPTTLALLSAALGRLGAIEQHVVIIGGGRWRQAAAAVGVVDGEGVRVHALAIGRAWAAWRSVAALLREHGPFDVIHCWSPGAFSVATLLARQTPRALTLTLPPDRHTVHWLRTLCLETARHGWAAAALLPISSTIRRSLLAGGVPEPAVHVLRPALDLAMVPHDQRATLRRQWGIDERNRSAKIIALLSDPPGATDCYAAALGLGLAQEARPHLDCYLLVHPDQRSRLTGQRMFREARGVARIIQEPRLATPWAALPGCDLALSLGDGGGGMSLLWAMAANVPAIGEAVYAVSEILEDRHSALLVTPQSPQQLGRRITQLLDDQQLAWRLRDTARHEAFSFFSRRQYCQSIQNVYGQLAAGNPIAVPDLEVTGGLRFSGRA